MWCTLLETIIFLHSEHSSNKFGSTGSGGRILVDIVLLFRRVQTLDQAQATRVCVEWSVPRSTAADVLKCLRMRPNSNHRLFHFVARHV